MCSVLSLGAYAGGITAVVDDALLLGSRFIWMLVGLLYVVTEAMFEPCVGMGQLNDHVEGVMPMGRESVRQLNQECGWYSNWSRYTPGWYALSIRVSGEKPCIEEIFYLVVYYIFLKKYRGKVWIWEHSPLLCSWEQACLYTYVYAGSPTAHVSALQQQSYLLLHRSPGYQRHHITLVDDIELLGESKI